MINKDLATTGNIIKSVHVKRKHGRPRQGADSTTIEKEATLKEFKRQIWKNARHLFAAAKVAAMGSGFVYRIDETTEGKVTKKKSVLVTDPDEIKEAIDFIELGGQSDNYYYITVKEPNISAIELLLNRGYGVNSKMPDVDDDDEKKTQLVVNQFRLSLNSPNETVDPRIAAKITAYKAKENGTTSI